ncbi:ATP-dependent helicase [Actinokineospora inagensis]|uniref:ATP-dependent helicase n=1 Tax=Actinokineospora inagensis TaxID=103730 RepID=UPI00041325E0|nr:ATP-dependent DNA helicase [Actinokineospora inagensis]
MVAGKSSLAPRLVRVPLPRGRTPRWTEDAQRVLAGADGFVRVLGGPGSGKTTLLAELAADRILRGGVDPEQLLVLTASRRAAADLRGRITALLTDQGAPRTVREPLVRTVHSYAFAVLRIQAMLHDGPGPRLLSGPEQDAVIRELLEGDLDMGARHWPERLRPALSVPGFAEELRDLILRASERGLGPEDLMELGSREGREEWVAAGRFGRQYEQVTLLLGSADTGIAHTTAPALDAAELVASALLAFDTDTELLSTERARVRYLLVDDAQHLDPLQYALLRTLGTAAKEFVVAGDPDQAIFSFRGADPALLRDADPGGGTVLLGSGHRMAPAVRKAVSHLAARLPGGARRIDKGRDNGGTVTVRLHPSAAAEASWVANQLRRAHLIDEVPWAEMAVLVRSATRSLPVLHRALAAAGVPVAAPGDELPLSQQPAVRPLLALLRCAAVPALLDPAMAEMLLASQLGGADPLALRRLRRGLRRLELTSGGDKSSDELLVDVLNDDDRLAALADTEAGPVRRVGGLISLARKGIEEGVGLEQILWDVWQASGLEVRWVSTASRGGPVGAQADRDLDAVVALFHAAQRFAERFPGADVAGFVANIGSQRIAGDTLAPTAPQGDAVAVLTAHAAAGREWTVVAVPGVQEGAWPDLRLRGSLLGVERLVDLLAGVRGEEVSAVAPLLAEERRLLLVAASRARSKLLVSAVRGEEEQPSRFLAELAGAETADTDMPVPMAEQERALVLADLVGELRQVVCDAGADQARRGLAARQLARLASAGVPGAHPDSWYGLPALSSVAPLRAHDEPVRVSPSTVEILVKCPLRWMVERHGGQDPAELAAVTGTLVHALAQAAAAGATRAELMAELDRAWSSVDAGAPWFSRREQQRVRAMVDTFLSWLRNTRSELTQVAVEREVKVELPDGITVAGRVDRLEVDSEGRPVIVDIKTGKSPVSANDAEEHPQLAVYQLAVAYGAFSDVGTDPGGARLLYVSKANKKTGATERTQSPVRDESADQWLTTVREAAAATVGPDYTAYENPDCPRCPVRTACPLHPSGRQVTE